MKLALTGSDWVKVVLALADVKANRSYNTLQVVLQAFGDATLSNDALDYIKRTQSMSVDLATTGNTSWQVIAEALSELPIKQVGGIYDKITQAVSAGDANDN